MALGVGEIVEGKVTGLTKFGAFVSLPEEKVGMIHISEVSTTYVKDIGDFLEKGQAVKVKVLSIDENGKISLSLKQVPENAEVVKKAADDSRDNGERRERKRSAPNVWQGQKSKFSDKQDLTFEEMMSQFKQQSDDKLTDLKRATESKHGGFSRRGGNKRYG
ncbi:MAG: S1 RNA-binding domain-containing protein [Clostridia bacterium]|nr:S1 RNA-binding domain-containing protein [Clostridia bacterium]MBQ2437913.1 S1 RNA-binding domain-containing protein [Clostridia bacterium]MBQ3326619.1 S1 RNA-binding domain-containing protein [Clostridia bacterium]MBQ3995561.1 S1 RNA-binding domain-containing protein [Clostridia bacterium]MBQ4458772.1 S1 RNA-binding domain-containing protein [Clostridia bacterium]